MNRITLAAAAVAMLFASPVLAAKSGETIVYFKNCKAAAAAGYSDMARGEPGYAPRLDRDKDGIACETDHNWDN